MFQHASSSTLRSTPKVLLPSAYDVTKLYPPHGNYTHTRGATLDEGASGVLLGNGSACVGYLRKGILCGQTLAYISKICNIWDGFHTELYLYAHPRRLRPLQGICVPYIIGVFDAPGALANVAMELPHPVAWRTATRSLSRRDKRSIVDAYTMIHAQGVLHRAVSLSHMLIGEDGRATIINFRHASACSPAAEAGLIACEEHEFDLEMREVKFLLDYDNARAKEFHLAKACARQWGSNGVNLATDFEHYLIPERTLRDWEEQDNVASDTWYEVPDDFVLPRSSIHKPHPRAPYDRSVLSGEEQEHMLCFHRALLSAPSLECHIPHCARMSSPDTADEEEVEATLGHVSRPVRLVVDTGAYDGVPQRAPVELIASRTSEKSLLDGMHDLLPCRTQSITEPIPAPVRPIRRPLKRRRGVEEDEDVGYPLSRRKRVRFDPIVRDTDVWDGAAHAYVERWTESLQNSSPMPRSRKRPMPIPLPETRAIAQDGASGSNDRQSRPVNTSSHPRTPPKKYVSSTCSPPPSSRNPASRGPFAEDDSGHGHLPLNPQAQDILRALAFWSPLSSPSAYAAFSHIFFPSIPSASCLEAALESLDRPESPRDIPALSPTWSGPASSTSSEDNLETPVDGQGLYSFACVTHFEETLPREPDSENKARVDSSAINPKPATMTVSWDPVRTGTHQPLQEHEPFTIVLIDEEQRRIPHQVTPETFKNIHSIIASKKEGPPESTKQIFPEAKKRKRVEVDDIESMMEERERQRRRRLPLRI